MSVIKTSGEVEISAGIADVPIGQLQTVQDKLQRISAEFQVVFQEQKGLGARFPSTLKALQGIGTHTLTNGVTNQLNPTRHLGRLQDRNELFLPLRWLKLDKQLPILQPPYSAKGMEQPTQTIGPIPDRETKRQHWDNLRGTCAVIRRPHGTV